MKFHFVAPDCSAAGPPRANGFLLIAVLLAAAAAGEVPNVAGAIPPSVGRHGPLVVTQLLPEGVGRQSLAARGESFPRARLLLIFPDSSTRVFSDGFFSARDPDVSFDGLRLLFSGKKTADDGWDIYEAPLDGRGARQITKGLGDCWNPCYQGTLFTLDSPAPWYQVTFVRGAAGVMNENDEGPRTNLYSCKLDGSAVRQLTFNLSSDAHPWQLDDGRVLLASWQRATLDRGPTGHVGLFSVNTDGVDYSLFAEDHGSRTGHMPCVTRQGLVVFVETDEAAGDGAGWLASVTLRRPLHSYHAVTRPADGLFRCPAPLPDGRILACRKGPGAGNTYDVCCVDPASGTWETVFHDPQYSTVQVRSIYPRPEPDGRSSNVIEEDPHGKLYCLNVYTTDLANPAWLPPGSAKRLRVLEGVPRGKRPASAVGGRARFVEKMAVRRLLDEVELADDGSFNIQIPANIPIQLQLVDARGMALRTCAGSGRRTTSRADASAATRMANGCRKTGSPRPWETRRCRFFRLRRSAGRSISCTTCSQSSGKSAGPATASARSRWPLPSSRAPLASRPCKAWGRLQTCLPMGRLAFCPRAPTRCRRNRMSCPSRRGRAP